MQDVPTTLSGYACEGGYNQDTTFFLFCAFSILSCTSIVVIDSL
jgi:hypothetical protein